MLRRIQREMGVFQLIVFLCVTHSAFQPLIEAFSPSSSVVNKKVIKDLCHMSNIPHENTPVPTTSSPLNIPLFSESRRSFFSGMTFTAAILATSSTPSSAAVVSQTSGNVFKAGQELSKDDALSRFKQGQKDLQYLIDNFDKISSEGGDNIRRYLGTVGTTSGLYGITKVMKVLQKESDDIVEYTESMNDFDRYLRGADSSAYSANFVEFSSAKTKPEQFFKDAKKDAVNMKVAMDNMAKELNI